MRTSVRDVKETEEEDDTDPELADSVGRVSPPPVAVKPALVGTAVVSVADLAVVEALDMLVVGLDVALDSQHLSAEQINPASQYPPILGTYQL